MITSKQIIKLSEVSWRIPSGYDVLFRMHPSGNVQIFVRNLKILNKVLSIIIPIASKYDYTQGYSIEREVNFTNFSATRDIQYNFYDLTKSSLKLQGLNLALEEP